MRGPGYEASILWPCQGTLLYHSRFTVMLQLSTTAEPLNNGYIGDRDLVLSCPLLGGCPISEVDSQATPLNPEVESIERRGLWEIESMVLCRHNIQNQSKVKQKQLNKKTDELSRCSWLTIKFYDIYIWPAVLISIRSCRLYI